MISPAINSTNYKATKIKKAKINLFILPVACTKLTDPQNHVPTNVIFHYFVTVHSLQRINVNLPKYHKSSVNLEGSHRAMIQFGLG